MPRAQASQVTETLTLLMRTQNGKATGESNLPMTYKVKHMGPTCPGMPRVGIHPREIKAYVHTNTRHEYS